MSNMSLVKREENFLYQTHLFFVACETLAPGVDIKSPNFPEAYPVWTDTCYIITVDAGKVNRYMFNGHAFLKTCVAALLKFLFHITILVLLFFTAYKINHHITGLGFYM